MTIKGKPVDVIVPDKFHISGTWAKAIIVSNSEPVVECNVFDQEEIHRNCTVQILTNSTTGEQSIGWWENETD